nr:molybdopterin cofactor-binding domain-containing protein [Grimontia sp. NTOU-MAR1]
MTSNYGVWFSLIWYAVRTPTPELSQSTKKKPSYYPRVHPSPLETYGCVASFDLVKGNLTVYVTSQAPHVVRTVVSSLSGISESKALGWQLDSGNYHFALQKVMDAVDYPTLLEEQKVKRENGELMGIGVCTFTEIVGAGPTRNCDILGISRDYHGNEFR